MNIGESNNVIQIPSGQGIRPRIIYDYDNAGYYLNMDGTSNLYAVTDYTRRAAFNLGRERGNRRDITSDQNHWTGTNGWATSYGTWASAWEGGFSGWDIWGTGTGHPQGGGYIHAQGIQSGLHYATAGGGTAYGWQMVGATNATDNRYWARGKWGGSTSAWKEFAMYGASIASSFYASIYYDSDNTAFYVDPNSTSILSTLRLPSATAGWSLMVGENNTTGVYNDNTRYGVVINAPYYPHLYLTATTDNANTTHGAVISMQGRLSAGGFRKWNIGIPNRNPNELSFGWFDNDPNPHYGVGINWGYPASMWIDTGHNLYARGSMRAPIFYDYDDTAYYFNGNGTSNASTCSRLLAAGRARACPRRPARAPPLHFSPTRKRYSSP
jgi:hypothetical protein